MYKISTKYQAAAGLAQAQRRAGPGPARARPAWARPAAAWYFVHLFGTPCIYLDVFKYIWT